MSVFFTARYLPSNTPPHKPITRDFFLPDASSVRREIINMGGVPLSIRERNLAWYEREYISRKYKIGFLRSLAFHIQAGMSPGKALALVIESEPHSRKRVELEPALEILRRGGGFTTAMRELHLFDRGTMAILVSGEHTGSLRDVIASAVAHMEERGKAWKMFVAALGWLWFDIGTSFSSVIGVQFFALPWLEQNGLSSSDPAALEKFQNAINLAYTINAVLLAIALLAVLVGAIIAAAYAVNRNRADHKINQIVAEMPLIRNFILNSAFGETFGIVGRMLQGKVPFGEAVRVAESSTPAALVKFYWQNCILRLEQGDSIERAMRSNLLTRAETLQISAHQNSSQLSGLMLNIAEDRTNAAKRNLQTLIVGGIAATIIYTFLAASSALWVVWVQNTGVNVSIEEITNTERQAPF